MKNAMRNFVLISVVVSASYFVVSCDFKGDYSVEIKRLDSLSAQLDSSRMMLKKMMGAETSADSALNHLQFIQQNYRSTMPQSTAIILNRYGLMRKNMITNIEFSQTLRIRLDSVQRHIVDLRQALQEGATHDSKDNKLTGDYVKSVILFEDKKVGELLAKVKQYQNESGDVQKIYYELTPQIKMMVDSISDKGLK